MFRRALCAVPFTLIACGGSTSLPIDARCNPLGAGACLAPWPSSAFEIDDPSTATGRRLAIPEEAIPRGVSDAPIDPTRWNALDGFSATTSIVVEFPDGVSELGLAAYDNMDLSIAADSPTVILDMTTGERVAHYVDVEDTALVLHPAARLAAGHRFAVAITSRVVAADGSELPVPAGFRALRDDRRTDHHLLEAMRPRFDDVLDALDEAEVDTAELIVAWDFTVASEAAAHADVTTARERALATLANYPSLYTITSERRDRQIRRELVGTLDGPLVLSNGGEARAGTRVVRDEAGLPAVQGLYRIPFAALVPECAYRAAGAVPIVIWGHGAFGDAGDVLGAHARGLASELCAVIVGTDLRGLSRADLPAVQRAIEDLGHADELDTLVQGVLDHTTLAVALRTVLAQQLFVDRGRSLVDPARIYYAGDSTAIAALPEVSRAVISSPMRDAYQRELAARTATTYQPVDALLVGELIEARWDRAMPARLPHPVLVIGSGESTSWLARTFGLPTLGPPTPWGVKALQVPSASGILPTASAGSVREFLATGSISPM